MKCPVCKDVSLVMSDRQGVEIDYCPQCRGIWLDRGELDKIIERSEAAARPKGYQQDHTTLHYADPRRQQGYREGTRHKRRESFLGELFDFD